MKAPGGSRFGGIGDSLLDSRFDPKEKERFKAQLDRADAHKEEKTYPIPVSFYASRLDPKAEEAIKKIALAFDYKGIENKNIFKPLREFVKLFN